MYIFLRTLPLTIEYAFELSFAVKSQYLATALDNDKTVVELLASHAMNQTRIIILQAHIIPPAEKI